MPRALFIYGGWDGHTPRESVEVFAPWLRRQGFEVLLRDDLAAFDDVALLRACDLIVPCWTLGELSAAQERNLCDVIADGCGLAGWHGGMGDAFRVNTQYQYMVGGQFVAHPGDILDRWTVRIVDQEHYITRGLSDFEMHDTERYYLHVDPSNHVLAATTIAAGCEMPVCWVRRWGRGRVAYISVGHTWRDFDVPSARTMMQRCLLWATRQA